jgi:hypothetical protein
MIREIDLQDVSSHLSVAEFAARNNLDLQTLRSCIGVIILPNNTIFSKVPEQHLFSAHAKEVRAVLDEARIDARMYQDSKERRELVLKSATVVLPVMYFVGTAVSSLALGVLSNWIYGKFFKDSQSEAPTTVELEYAELDVDGNVRWRRIEGSAEHVAKLLQQASQRDVAPRLTRNESNTDSLTQCKADRRKKHKNAARKRKR